MRLTRELKGLRDYNNPGLFDRVKESKPEVLFCFLVADTEEEIKQEPETFQEAWYHPNPQIWENWRQAIRLKFRQMIKNMVWTCKGISILPEGRKGIDCKWVFKIKKDGTYCARLIAKGYNQKAGVDFQYNFAPVTSEKTLHLMLLSWKVNSYKAEVADVQTAFLHGNLKEELFLTIPEGYKEFLQENEEQIDGDYLKFDKSIYGLVQAAQAWWKRFV